MLHSKREHQSSFEFVCIEELVPQNHLLRQIDKYIDFSFILDKVRHMYSESKGRPSIDPVMLFKMIFVGYLFGIRSERQLELEIQTNVAYRWFLGLGLTDRVPDHSTISWNRRTRFHETNVFQEIFDEILLQAVKHRMVAGRVLMTDSTHIKANANKRKFVTETVKQKSRDYLNELDEAVEEDRKKNGKKL